MCQDHHGFRLLVPQQREIVLRDGNRPDEDHRDKVLVAFHQDRHLGVGVEELVDRQRVSVGGFPVVGEILARADAQEVRHPIRVADVVGGCGFMQHAFLQQRGQETFRHRLPLGLQDGVTAADHVEPVENLLLEPAAVAGLGRSEREGDDHAGEGEYGNAVGRVDAVQGVLEGLQRDALVVGSADGEHVPPGGLQVDQVEGGNGEDPADEELVLEAQLDDLDLPQLMLFRGGTGRQGLVRDGGVVVEELQVMDVQAPSHGGRARHRPVQLRRGEGSDSWGSHGWGSGRRGRRRRDPPGELALDLPPGAI